MASHQPKLCSEKIPKSQENCALAMTKNDTWKYFHMTANDNGRCIFVPRPGSPFTEHNLIRSFVAHLSSGLELSVEGTASGSWCAFSELTKEGQSPTSNEVSGGGPERSLDMKVVTGGFPLVGGVILLLKNISVLALLKSLEKS